MREHDANGFFEMPGSRVLHAPVDHQSWYYANTRSAATPQGFGQEETIKAIWSEDRSESRGWLVSIVLIVSAIDKAVAHLQLSPFSYTAPCDGSLLSLEG